MNCLIVTGLQAKVDNGIQAVGQKQAAVETWWDGLTPAQQTKPGEHRQI